MPAALKFAGFENNPIVRFPGSSSRSNPTRFDSRETERALRGSKIKVPRLETYAWRLWDYWERHLDPDLYRDRTLVGAVRGRRGIVSGVAEVLEQQIPDEILRTARRVQGSASLEKAVRGRVIMVTGASSGIGRSAALKIADSGGTVLLVARSPEKLESTREAIEAAGGSAYIHRCDLADFYLENGARPLAHAVHEHRVGLPHPGRQPHPGLSHRARMIPRATIRPVRPM